MDTGNLLAGLLILTCRFIYDLCYTRMHTLRTCIHIYAHIPTLQSVHAYTYTPTFLLSSISPISWPPSHSMSCLHVTPSPPHVSIYLELDFSRNPIPRSHPLAQYDWNMCIFGMVLAANKPVTCRLSSPWLQSTWCPPPLYLLPSISSLVQYKCMYLS